MRKTVLFMAAALITLGTVVACTDVDRADLTNFGQPGRVTCYSGGVKRFDDFSTGRLTLTDGGIYRLVSESTGRLTEASGDCTADYGATRPVGFVPVRETDPSDLRR